MLLTSLINRGHSSREQEVGPRLRYFQELVTLVLGGLSTEVALRSSRSLTRALAQITTTTTIRGDREPTCRARISNEGGQLLNNNRCLSQVFTNLSSESLRIQQGETI